MPAPQKKFRKKVEKAVEAITEVIDEAESIVEDELPETVEELSIEDVERDIGKLIKASTYEPEAQYWLDTGSPELNAALGSKNYGIPYGKVLEIRGKEHGGKTVLGTIIGGLAQKDGAACGYIDLENSRDPLWAMRLGWNLNKTLLIYPKLILGDGKKRDRLQSAEDLFDRVEVAMQIFRMKGFKKQFWLLDSVANIVTDKAEEAGTTGRNMNVNLDRAAFLSATLPRLAGKAYNYNAMIFMINQLRNNPAAWGNPKTSPGGRALNHACAVRADVGRIKKGELEKNGVIVGIRSKVENFKNKAGRGSRESESAAFKVRWDKDPASIKFMSLEEGEEL